MKRFTTILMILIIIGGVFTACTSSSAGGKLQVQNAWARPGQAGGTSAVYFVINAGGEADTLLSASCGAAEASELHMSKMDGDKMMMEPQQNVPVPANQTVTFEPGGLHVMLLNLKNDLKAGETLPVTLTFEKAGTIEIKADVKEP